jgi:hypothetical protein
MNNYIKILTYLGKFEADGKFHDVENVLDVTQDALKSILKNLAKEELIRYKDGSYDTDVLVSFSDGKGNIYTPGRPEVPTYYPTRAQITFKGLNYLDSKRTSKEDSIDKIEASSYQETSKLLIPYPASKQLFEAALSKIHAENTLRNAVDDLRLSLELLLRQLFNNSKSLEKQISHIAQRQISRNGSVELSNMFHRVLDCYTKFQNENVKHGNKINVSEAKLLLDVTSAFVKYLI